MQLLASEETIRCDLRHQLAIGIHMSEEEKTIFRRVYFFRVERFEEIRDSLPDAIRRIETLPFSDTGRYRMDGAGRYRLSIWSDSDEYPLKIRFGKIKRDALPQVEDAGNLQELQLKEDAGLVDLSHILIFENGFVAAEWNPEGPRIGALGHYLFEKGRLNTAPKFLSLLERDIVEVLQKLSAVRSLEIDLPYDAIELAREADGNLAAAIEATTKLGASRKTGFVLMADKPSESLKRLALGLASILKVRPQEKDRVHSLSVRGYQEGSRQARFVDILESKLVTAESFPRNSGRHRSINTVEAYKILNDLYLDNLDRIVTAAGTPDF